MSRSGSPFISRSGYEKVRTASSPSCSATRSEIAAGPRGSGGCGSPFLPHAAASGRRRRASAARRSASLENVTGEVLVAHEVGERRPHVFDVDRDRAPRVLRARERDLLEQAL